MDENKFNELNKDIFLIESLGGVSALAERLGYTVQRVYNWTVRGIPAHERLKHKEILLKENDPS